MNAEQEAKHFVACVECGEAVMATVVASKKKRSISKSGSKYQFKVTFCGKHKMAGIIKSSSTFDDHGVRVSINRRMVETWYVYLALMKHVGGDIELEEDDENPGAIRLVNADEYIHPKYVTYELTSIKVNADNSEDHSVEMYPKLMTGFF